jgi:cyclic beta-1,2-glucan synthetase
MINLKNKLNQIFKDVTNNYLNVINTYKILEKTYELGISIHPAGQWVLDNMYIIEQEYSNILEDKNHVKNLKLPILKTHDGSKYTSIFYMANELIEKNKGYVDQNHILECLKEHQKLSYLTSEEINLFPLMLRIAIIKFISRICSNICNSQLQKLEVEKIIDENNISKFFNVINRDFKFFKQDEENILKLKNTNTAFVEYMASRLKGLGNSYSKYYDILTSEAEKIGFTVEEAILKEHMEMAKTTDYMGKAILGLKQLQSLNYREIFEEVNKIDEILMNDYSNEFRKCDYKTKERYRNRIIKLSKKYILSETYIAKKAVECSVKYKKHVGFFLSGDFKYILKKELGKSHKYEIIRNKIIKPLKPISYILSILLMAFLLTVLLEGKMFITENLVVKVIYDVLIYFFMVEISEKLINYFLRKTLSPKILPRFDFAKTIDEQYSTYIVMPTVISSIEKIDVMIRKMEVTYLANRSENMYYMLLGDAISSDKENIDIDKKYVEYAKEKLDELNDKYTYKHKLFNFMYRKRIWSKAENCYMGWERKRGALKHFNELVLGKLSKEQIDERMYLIYDDIVKTKYAITIDEDTELSLNTAKDLVAIIAHPLNKPILDKNKKVVKSGHALIQPAVGLDIEAANKSMFSKIFGGFGGLDIYTNAVSNTYQDLFNEAIFCGKGIYDIELFEKLLSEEIPENLVLSHDLLEGSYLRAGLASDIQVQDGFPHNYIAYTKRNHRWLRGDMQIIKWLFKSPLNLLSKWKILDNIRRPMVDVFCLLIIILSLFISQEIFVRTVLISFFVINIGHILGLIDSFIFGRVKHTKELLYIPIIHGVKANILTMVFNFITIPYKAYNCINAFTLSLYRIIISKQKLLQWTTAEVLEKTSKNKLSYYYINMFPNIVVALLIIISYQINISKFLISEFQLFIAISFLIAPFFACLLGKSHLFGRKKRLNKKQDEDVIEIAKRTWLFFDSMMTPVNNYLPTDNYQENRRFKIVNRTSSTNIGFGILSIINAYDLNFIDKEVCLEKLNNIMNTITKLEKWNGHLLNWYNIKTLQPLRPRFVSTVDSGNFLACIYILKEFLTQLNDDLALSLINICEDLIKNTDFKKLYDMSRNLFSIGYNQDEGKLIDSYYDMLMSENRTTSLLAIASLQITSKHWFALSRNLVNVDGYKGLVSWSGTAFEYFMPYLFNKSYEHTLIDQSLFFAQFSQKKHAKSNNVAWGISESAFAVKDSELNYQYQAFGIPWLGLKRGLKDYLVISPYSSLLMIEYNPEEVYKNILRLKKLGCYSSYGFYEAIDYTKKHLNNNDFEVVKTYMAHHQGMILTAINNYINNGIIKNRFHSNPNIEACEILLKEREKLKANIVKKSKVSEEEFKQKDINKYSTYILSTKNNEKVKENRELTIGMLKGRNLSTIITNDGASYLKYRDKIVNRQSYKDTLTSGNYIYLTDKITSNTFSTANTNIVDDTKKSSFNVFLDHVEYYREDDELETTTTVFLAPEFNMEVRKVSIYNASNIKREIVINTYIEPAMTDFMTNIVHPSFNNLQIETYYDKDLETLIAFKRLKNENDKELYLYSKLLCIDLNKDIETEKNKLDTSEAYDNKISKYPLWPILSYQTKILLDSYERQEFYYVVGIADNKYKMSNAIVNLTNNILEKQMKLSSELNTIVSRYLKLEPYKGLIYNTIIKELIFDKKHKQDKYWNSSFNQSMLWKYSISGDLPIMLVNVCELECTSYINEVIEFMDYVKNRKLDIDIVIFIESEHGNKLYDYINNMINKTNFIDYTKGNIYLFNVDNMDKKDVELFKFIAKKEISDINIFIKKDEITEIIEE